MSTKSKVIEILESKRGEAVSGETLAEVIGCSRTAIWKAITKLKSEGYQIEAKANKGYILSDKSDILSEEAIWGHTPLGNVPNPNDNLISVIDVYKTIDSTNAEAKRRISEAPSPDELPFGDIIIAEEQTAGRGRRGRNFHSPLGGSIYISFILKPYGNIENSLMITIAAALAVCKAIEKISDPAQTPKIKWVNDIFIDNKKVCGILTEAVSDIESGQIESIVLGIGININIPKEAFPNEIAEIAGSLKIKPGERNSFVAHLIEEVYAAYQALAGKNNIIDEYRKRSLMKDINIKIIQGSKTTDAVSKEIADDGSLLVEYKGGAKELLHSGEVSVRFLP
jgi:BirA family biotin operon repressor/biotin-[acetyl-CoA-carboxylase] ligase